MYKIAFRMIDVNKYWKMDTNMLSITARKFVRFNDYSSQICDVETR